MIFIYNLLILLIYIILFIPLLFTTSGRERLSLILPIHKCDIWIHASSVGEVKLLQSLLIKLFNVKEKRNLKIHLTVMTSGGYKTAEKFLKTFDFLNSRNFTFSFVPIDLSFCIKRLINKLNPKLLLITESDHWYNLLNTSKQNQIPIVLINGRISNKSRDKFANLPSYAKKIFSCYDFMFFKSLQDQLKYLDFFIDAKKTKNVGDMKFDAPFFKPNIKIKSEIITKLKLNNDSLILVAGSTRPPNEEIYLIDVYIKLKKNFPNLVLILAPRHLKRVNLIKDFCRERNVSYRLLNLSYSTKNINSKSVDSKIIESKNINTKSIESKNINSKKNIITNTDCIIINSMGQLNYLYELANLSFVGGTMTNTGGHNILEPVWARTPVLFGPDTVNIPDLADYVLKNNFGAQVKNPTDLYNIAFNFFNKNLTFKIISQKNLKQNATEIISNYILSKYL